MNDLQKDTLTALPSELREQIDAHITARLLAFYDSMIERGQIPSPPPQSGATADYTADRTTVECQSQPQFERTFRR